MSGENPDETLTSGREARVARQRLDRQDEYVNALRRAQWIRASSGTGGDDERLRDLVEEGQTEQRRLLTECGGRIHPRKKSGRAVPRDSNLIFLDECGSSSIKSDDERFPIFSLAAVVIREAIWQDVDLRWRTWKATNLGSIDAKVHEPELRHRQAAFNREDCDEILASLAQTISNLDFSLVVSVVRRPEYATLVGAGPLDESLPENLYLMSLDFLFERLVMALADELGNGRARVIAESRGPKEDALLQYEFARLHLHGTSYISSSWFRKQLHPGISFESKGGEHASGLELADLAARPCGEKVLRPQECPDRWEIFRLKLCQARQTKNSILGLKIMPWDERYADLWKS